ncbi:hypothetical protein [Bacteroides caecimuris]|uniref:hypothetical protein n=1 Tax=Bacteroides caecimuris TaxID=1796613 RepID=UPI00266EA02A|nr:hypothetical protein [Bacteroides caecimuris]
MQYGEITFILKLVAEDSVTDNRVILFSHKVESLYRGALIEDYNEDLTEALDIMFKRYEIVRKNIDDRITLMASISMVSPFLARPITKYLRKSTAREFIFEQDF